MSADITIHPNSSLLEFLHSRGAMGEIFSFKEVCEVIRLYIINKVLYDHENTRLIHCDEALTKVLGVKQFIVPEVVKLIISQSTFIKSSSLALSSSLDKDHHTYDHLLPCFERKRKKSVGDSNSENGLDSKKARSITFDFCGDSNDSSSEVLSIQGYETAVIQDSSDEVWLSGTEKGTLSIDRFSVEYEVASDSGTEYSDSDNDLWADDIIGAAAAAWVCAEDDEGFWADSEMSDLEMTEADKWKCASCGTLNSPLRSKCDKCWISRDNWLPDKKKEKFLRSISAPGILERAGEPVVESILCGNSFGSCELSDTVAEREIDSGLSEAGPSCSGLSSSSQSVLSEEDKCMICYSRPKVASLLHGITAHQVCCYPCGQKLKQNKKSCPICRRPIQKVIKNII